MFLTGKLLHRRVRLHLLKNPARRNIQHSITGSSEMPVPHPVPGIWQTLTLNNKSTSLPLSLLRKRSKCLTGEATYKNRTVI